MIALLSALLLTASVPPRCVFEDEPRRWTEQALQAWDQLDHDRIRMQAPTTPTLILFDEACVYRFTPATAGPFRVNRRTYSVRAEAHAGMVDLPGGGQVPARKLSFAAPTEDGGMFFVMSLPAVWRADKAEARDPARLAMVVFMHEFAHTQQGAGLGRRIDDLIRRGLPESADDDSLQKTWSSVPGYVEAYEHERDLLYASAQAATYEVRRAKLDEAAAAMDRRRETYLADKPLWREADDVFLTFEGTGNWAAWAWLTDPKGGAMAPQDATAFVRGGRRWWSQDEGLGAMLALDGLMPEWPGLAFSDQGVTFRDLIVLSRQAKGQD
ncbi:hypothetical protein CA606_02570 [Caulobacter vibrioides]|uniref:Uncharacterized protein n=1 Tax=Caulobacter vibrioides TaxID=155892 RepID=A0A290MND8_CAUVI|nr:hypothetical protein [Caulobacter vibrioides]ATC31319.1 hypothetical protein CA606_02570 [Caulobacter vibrioides]